MKKVFLETSVLIRFFTRDHEQKYQQCLALFEAIEAGKFRPYISNIVLLEVIFVLTRLYKFSLQDVVQDLTKFLDMRNLTVIEKTDSLIALEMLKTYSLKPGDSFIISQIKKDMILVTYDREFLQLPSLSIFTPDELLS